ncbi:14849_t:CDS:2, partial [Funneliformis mosseae]
SLIEANFEKLDLILISTGALVKKNVKNATNIVVEQYCAVMASKVLAFRGFFKKIDMVERRKYKFNSKLENFPRCVRYVIREYKRNF